MKWERTFEFSAPVQDVWDAFTSPDAPFPVMNFDNAYQSGGAVRIDVTERSENAKLAWTETEDDMVWEMSVTFTETETKTRITIVRSGFGGDDWLERAKGRLLGWQDVLADLEIFFRTGTKLNRLYSRKWGRFGLHAVAADGGLRVLRVQPGGPAAEAGLLAGDVIVRMAGAPTVHNIDLWTLESAALGDDIDVEFVRGSSIESSRITLPVRA